MSDRRIRIPKDKAEIVKRLKLDLTENRNGVFNQYSDILVFAAMLGYNRGTFIPFEGSLMDPIRWNVFLRSGTDKIFYLLALVHDGKPDNLGTSDECEDLRITIFEGYANGGLSVLESELHGKSDPLDHLLLMIINEGQQALTGQ